MGGLDDYIGSLTNQQVVDYIMKEVKEHPEIASSNKLDGLVTQFGITGGSWHQPTPMVSATAAVAAPRPQTNNTGIIGGDGGLHDFIWRLPRDKLDQWALATEKYHRKINNLHLMGGLHDYIGRLTNDQVIDYIMKEVKEHPEIAGSSKLDGLVAELLPKGPKVGSGSVGGLDDYIWRLPRSQIESYALALENYHRGNRTLIGGLHDYINTLSNADIVTYILKETKEHPEVASLDQLNLLVGPSDSALTGGAPGSGLTDVVRTLNRDSLIAYALAIDKYSHELKPRMGGVDDYVFRLHDDEIRNFILKQVALYPEINSRSVVEGLITKYNIKVGGSN